MKIQCDVCSKQNASLFCAADEAALCEGCDHRVHGANSLASKHERFSLCGDHLPVCDVCQERRGLVFCQEDRAIVCRECDVGIHSANQVANNHNRFLLTGIKFSATATATATAHTTSSISDYLINTIPGMKFEDFLDSNGELCLSPHDQHQNGIANTLAFRDDNFIVPQLTPPPNHVSKRSRLHC